QVLGPGAAVSGGWARLAARSSARAAHMAAYCGHLYSPHLGAAEAALYSARHAAGYAVSALHHRKRGAEGAAQAGLLRVVSGTPFRPAGFVGAWAAWSDGLIPKLARATSEERVLDGGTLDAARVAVLADALEDAGCPDSGILRHLRGPEP